MHELRTFGERACFEHKVRDCGIPRKNDDGQSDSKGIQHNAGVEDETPTPSAKAKGSSDKTCHQQKKPSIYFQRRIPTHRSETDDSVMISLDVPGFGADNLNVTIEDHCVLVKGKRQNRMNDTFIVFQRFSLARDSFDEESIKADLSDGVLDITLEKKQVPKVRVIPIRTAAAAESVDEDECEKTASTTNVDEDTEEEDQVCAFVEQDEDGEEDEHTSGSCTKEIANPSLDSSSTTASATILVETVVDENKDDEDCDGGDHAWETVA